MKSIIIVSGPSGVGKSTLDRKLIRQVPDIRLSISHTTREPRGREENGTHYHFVDESTFKTMLDKGELAEWTRIHGNYYGTSHAELLSVENGQYDLILEIEGQGAMQIKQKYPDARSVFVLPPSLDELRRRIEGRKEDPPEQIQRRMDNAIAEIEYIDKFDYIVINDEFEKTLEQISTIVRAIRLRRELVWPQIARKFGK